jgi:hypothetical protein
VLLAPRMDHGGGGMADEHAEHAGNDGRHTFSSLG